MSFYGSNSQGNGPPAPGQRTSVQTHNMQQNQSAGVDVLPSQLFNFTSSQLQFQPGGHNLSFSDPNNPSMQMQNIQLGGGGPQLLLQQQQQNFPNLNVNFLTEQMGVGQILQPPTGNQGQSMSMQNLITPMSVALGGGVNFAQSANIQAQSATSQASQQAKQRVFTGTVTKTHDNFGFIDEEVFFQMSVVKGVVLPKPGDRVLVEADFNPAMPFKWNATRVQIVNIGGLNSSLPNMNLNPGGKPQSPQPMSHASQSASMLSQHSNASSAANLLNMNFNQNHSGNQKNSQSAQNSQSGLSSSGHSQGPQQSQAGNPRYQSGSNPVSIVSNPHSAYGVRNNPRPEDNSRAHPGARPQRARPPPPPVSAPPPPMVSLATMDPHNVPHIQLPLPLQLPMSVPLQLPSLLQLDRDVDKLDRERDIRDRERDRDRDRERLEREKEHDRRERERERERSLEREKEREKEREREYERKREREREREREKQKRLKDEVKRDRDKDRDREKRDSPARSIRNRSPIQLIRESRKRSRSRSKARDKDKEVRERSKSRSTSPKRLPVLRDRPTPRYGWELPRTALDVIDVSVMELKRRYRNLYIPSDFILARCSWQETFPLQHPMELSHACPIHIFRRHTEKIELAEVSFKLKSKESETTPVVLNPPDENDSLKVKVVLLSLPNKATLYRKACGLAEDPSDSSLQHPNRLINFVVGTKMAKNETMIIGGSWSPSLDGPNPESDPQVLIRTAIRTTRALTGIDLRRCTKWYRFMELYYRRGNGNVETVIVLLPNIWTALPSRREWEDIQRAYKQVFVGADTKDSKSPAEERKGDSAAASSAPNVNQSKDLPMVTNPTEDGSSSVNCLSSSSSPGADQSHGEPDTKSESCPRVPIKSEIGMEQASISEDNDLKSTRKKPEEDDIYGDLLPATELPASDDFESGDLSIKMVVEEQTNTEILSSELTTKQSKPVEKDGALQDSTTHDTRVQAVSAASLNSAQPEAIVEEQVGGADTVVEVACTSAEEGKGTHFSLLDPKHMTVQKLREEMELRGASTKGLKKNQLVTRLAKILKTEESTESTTKILIINKHDTEECLMDESNIDETPDDMETDETLATTSVNGVDDHAHTAENIKLSDAMCDTPEKKNRSDSSCTPDEGSSGAGRLQKLGEQESLKSKTEEDSVIHESGQHGSLNDLDKNQLEEDSNKSISAQQNRLKKAVVTYLVPILPESTNDKTRKVWERRYSLPKAPNLLVHPSREAKSGIFDCNQHSLNTLRDYRLADNKEQSFEVSLCSEFFNEMLQRDFAFRIYRELVSQANMDDKEEKTSTAPVVTKDESPTKKRKISTSSSVTGTTKSKTVDPHLLLAFVFFDHTRCGYITDSDLEDLCLCIGLGLSRSQVRKLVQKVCTKGSLHYRKWTDSQVDDGIVVAETNPRDDSQDSSVSLLSQGIKSSLPTFGKTKQLLELQDTLFSSENGDALTKETQSLLAACDSDPSLVDAKKLRDQLEKNEKDRTTLDANIKLLRSSLNETKVQALELKKVNSGLKDELLRVKETVKKFETSESSALNDLDVLKKASERFIERVKDLVKLPAVVSKEKDSKLKEVAKKEKAETDIDSSSMES